MQYINLRQAFNEFTIFSLSDIRQLEPGFHRRRLNEWQGKGYIKKIIKEYYIFSEKNVDENVLFEIANRIYKPSYISLEMALSYHQLIPESTYGMTSVSSKRTYTFHTSLGGFKYRMIKPELYFGYEIIPYNGKAFKIAEPEKAILDFLYLNHYLKEALDFESLRLNEEMFFKKIDLDRLAAFSEKYHQKTLIKRLKCFVRYLASQKDKNNA